MSKQTNDLTHRFQSFNPQCTASTATLSATASTGIPPATATGTTTATATLSATACSGVVGAAGNLELWISSVSRADCQTEKASWRVARAPDHGKGKKD